MIAALVVVAMLAAITGCGAERTPAEVPTTPLEPVGVATYVDPIRDVRIQFPGNWEQRTDRAPVVFQTFSGRAVVTVYAYERRAVPVTDQDLETARIRLIREVSERNETFELFSSGVTEVEGTPAVEIVGVATVGQERARIRSVHLFKGRGEYVVDALAPPNEFDSLDASVFQPMVRSVRVGGSPGQ